MLTVSTLQVYNQTGRMRIHLIYVYTKRQESEKWILQNDWYFNLYTGNEEFTQKERKIIEKIDHAKITKNKHIETKYGLGTIRNLSSGCKTILNVLKNPEKIVNVDECGGNVLDELFSLDNIHLYMSRPERIHIAENVEICFNDEEVVKGRHGFEQWWTREYERRESDDL